MKNGSNATTTTTTKEILQIAQSKVEEWRIRSQNANDGNKHVTCPRAGCNYSGEKALIIQHLSRTCVKRMNPCYCCGAVIPDGEMKFHIL